LDHRIRRDRWFQSRYRGQRIRLSGSLRGNSIEGSAGLWLRVDERGATGAFDNMEDRALTGTTDWTEVSVVLDVEDDADTIALGVLLTGKGSVDIYDIRFETVTVDVPTTDLWSKGPVNLDFSE
jgi:hypothetical protein